jgi:hypothetical protein
MPWLVCCEQAIPFLILHVVDASLVSFIPLFWLTVTSPSLRLEDTVLKSALIQRVLLIVSFSLTLAIPKRGCLPHNLLVAPATTRRQPFQHLQIGIRASS